MRRVVVALLLAALAAPASALAQADSERLREAKELFFDRSYGEARDAWQAIAASGRGTDAQAALYWVARCSESLGESERALGEYAAYLASHPSDRTLVEEAKTSRVALAVKLARAGKRLHVGIAKDALGDPSSVVRYFAALQVASLGPAEGKPAVPVLKEILAREKDQDLVDRAKLALLRLDRAALAEASPEPPQRASGKARSAGWVRVRIYEKGVAKPKVAINVPVALADLVFKSLPDEAIADLRSEGYDARSFWEAVKKTGPGEILTVEGDEGERIQVWIE
jgi:hypothetical protein